MAQAQVGPGLFLGGGIGLSTQNSKETIGSMTEDGPKTTNFSIGPAVGYYFTENVGVGLRVGFGSSNTKQSFGAQDFESSTTLISAELFGRYASTIGEGNNFAWFAEVNAGYSNFTIETTVGNTTTEGDPISTIYFGIAPGLIFFPSPQFGIEATLGNIFGYSSITIEDADDSRNKEVINDLSILNFSTMSLNFGFYYYFNR